MYKAFTHSISITVMPRFMPEESSPGDRRYFFACAVEIIDQSLAHIQLEGTLLAHRRRARPHPGD